MRKTLSVLLFLLTGFLLLAGVALSEDALLRPLPLARTGLVQAAAARRTEQADLQRAGYTVTDTGGDIANGFRRERVYSLSEVDGSSAILRDTEFPGYVLLRRDLSFLVVFSVKREQPSADVSAVMAPLIAAAQRAVRQDPGIVAGLDYLATAAAPGVDPEALQSAVIDYMHGYSQPSTPLREACSGCGALSGVGDDYVGGPAIHRASRVRGTDWTITGSRHYFNGESAFTLEVRAQLPRS